MSFPFHLRLASRTRISFLLPALLHQLLWCPAFCEQLPGQEEVAGVTSQPGDAVQDVRSKAVEVSARGELSADAEEPPSASGLSNSALMLNSRFVRREVALPNTEHALVDAPAQVAVEANELLAADAAEDHPRTTGMHNDVEKPNGIVAPEGKPPHPYAATIHKLTDSSSADLADSLPPLHADGVAASQDSESDKLGGSRLHSEHEEIQESPALAPDAKDGQSSEESTVTAPTDIDMDQAAQAKAHRRGGSFPDIRLIDNRETPALAAEAVDSQSSKGSPGTISTGIDVDMDEPGSDTQESPDVAPHTEDGQSSEESSVTASTSTDMDQPAQAKTHGRSSSFPDVRADRNPDEAAVPALSGDGHSSEVPSTTLSTSVAMIRPFHKKQSVIPSVSDAVDGQSPHEPSTTASTTIAMSRPTHKRVREATAATAPARWKDEERDQDETRETREPATAPVDASADVESAAPTAANADVESAAPATATRAEVADDGADTHSNSVEQRSRGAASEPEPASSEQAEEPDPSPSRKTRHSHQSSSSTGTDGSASSSRSEPDADGEAEVAAAAEAAAEAKAAAEADRAEHNDDASAEAESAEGMQRRFNESLPRHHPTPGPLVWPEAHKDRASAGKVRDEAHDGDASVSKVRAEVDHRDTDVGKAHQGASSAAKAREAASGRSHQVVQVKHREKDKKDPKGVLGGLSGDPMKVTVPDGYAQADDDYDDGDYTNDQYVKDHTIVARATQRVQEAQSRSPDGLAQPIAPAKQDPSGWRADEPESDVLRLGEGLGAVANGISPAGGTSVNRDVRRRIQLQDCATILVLLSLFALTMSVSCFSVYKVAEDPSPVIFYSDPVLFRQRLTCEADDAESFLQTFNGAPQMARLRILGRRARSGSGNAAVGSMYWLRDLVRDVTMPPRRNHRGPRVERFYEGRQPLLFDVSLDLTPFIAGDGTLRSEEDAVSLNKYLRSENPLEILALKKSVVWDCWEDVATNVRQRLRALGFAGDVDVRFEAEEEIIIWRNDPWQNFVRSHVTKALVAISVVGSLFWFPYIWARRRKTEVRTSFKISLDITRYWELLNEGLHATEGFQCS